jgi:hypothetical protein
MENYWVGLIILSLGTISGLIYLALKSYIGKKFENIATIEDTGKITEAVESVKKTFQDDTERLKQELSVLTNKHNVLFAEEKDALHIYFSAWNVWINTIEIMSVDYVSKEYKDVEAIEKYRYDITKSKSFSYEKVLISMSKLQLFLNDDKIINAAYELNLKTGEHQKIHEDYIDDFVHFSFGICSLEKHLEEAKATDDKLGENRIKDVLMEKRQKLTECAMLFNETKQAKFNQVETAKKKFISLCRDYIRKDF